MKHIRNLYLTLIGTIFYSIIGFTLIKAQDSSIEQSSVKLSGSRYKTEEVIAKATIICVAEFDEVGEPITKSAGEATYPGVGIHVFQCLRGKLSSPTSIIVTVARERDLIEATPNPGTKYILFINQTKSWNTLLKLLPATADNINKVKRLIETATH